MTDLEARNGLHPTPADDTDEWLTIAESAERLHVPERTLRRLLARPDYAKETRQEPRQTKTGTRPTTVLPATLLAMLARHFEKWENPAEPRQDNAAGTGQNADNVAANTAIVVQTYERLIDELKTALEHERLTTRSLADALAREQTLRALPPAAEPHEPSPELRRPWWRWWGRRRDGPGR